LEELIARRREAIIAAHPIHIDMEITCQGLASRNFFSFIPGVRNYSP
uniref:EAL domain-containing protein n=1 Tax=Gongylonema pulchrum TaxID=637853 RepID=A0A183DKP2_9BILA